MPAADGATGKPRAPGSPDLATGFPPESTALPYGISTPFEPGRQQTVHALHRNGAVKPQGKTNGQKKPAHRERVYPSFGRVEETGATIASRHGQIKFAVSILVIRKRDDCAGQVFGNIRTVGNVKDILNCKLITIKFALHQVVYFLLVYY
jgi:hypothetical protein